MQKIVINKEGKEWYERLGFTIEQATEVVLRGGPELHTIVFKILSGKATPDALIERISQVTNNEAEFALMLMQAAKRLGEAKYDPILGIVLAAMSDIEDKQGPEFAERAMSSAYEKVTRNLDPTKMF